MRERTIQSQLRTYKTERKWVHLPNNPKATSGRHTCSDLGIALEKYQCQGNTPHSEDLFCTVLKNRPVPGVL